MTPILGVPVLKVKVVVPSLEMLRSKLSSLVLHGFLTETGYRTAT